MKRKRVKTSDIAKAAGVSPATISRVFLQHPYVKDEIRERVLKVARELGYSPKTSSSKNIFAILTTGTSELNIWNFEFIMIRAVSAELFKRGYDLRIITEQSIPFIHNTSFRGIVDISRIVNFKVSLPDIPRVTINFPLKGVHSVASDHKEGLVLAVNYLVRHGHKKIGFICGRDDNWGNRERIKGYVNTLEDNGIHTEKALLEQVNHDKIFEATARIVKRGATAIIISSEGMGLQLSYALYLLDKKIPEDISVISFEDKRITPFLSPPHTTIDQNFEKLAEAAVDILTKDADKYNKGSTADIIIKNSLIERDSVKKLM